MMNIREFLQQTEIAGVSLLQIVVWLFIIAVAMLVLMYVTRGVRWLLRRISPKREPTPSEADQGQSRSDEIPSRDFSPDETPAPGFFVTSSQESRKFQSGERSWTSRSLFGVSDKEAEQELAKIEPGEVPFADRSDLQFGSATPALASLMPETDERARELKQDLIHAGYYTPHAYDNFAAVRYLGMMLPIILFGVLLILSPPAIEWVFILAIVLGSGLGWALPRIYVRSRAAQRQREIEQALPDVIDLLNMCVSQGMTLRSAISRVSWEIGETYPAMSEELRIVAEQADLSTTEHALQNLNQRVNVPELHSLSSLLIQTERMGTNVSDSLDEYSDAMRTTLQQRADQKANAATFKLLFPTVLCLMPAVFMFLLGPAVIELSDFFQQGGMNQFNQGQQSQFIE